MFQFPGRKKATHVRARRRGPFGRPCPDPHLRRALRRQRDNMVDSLKCGLSMAEIADAIGVSDKRMRALVREILARRLPPDP